MKYTCRWCGLTFIGTQAVTRWSDHTWEHAHELPMFEWLTSGTTHENARSRPK